MIAWHAKAKAVKKEKGNKDLTREGPEMVLFFAQKNRESEENEKDGQVI